MEKKEQTIIDKFKSRIYTKEGEVNLRTVKQIAVEAGLEKPTVNRNEGILTINYEIIDPYGIAEGEILSIYNFCKWMNNPDNLRNHLFSDNGNYGFDKIEQKFIKQLKQNNIKWYIEFKPFEQKIIDKKQKKYSNEKDYWILRTYFDRHLCYSADKYNSESSLIPLVEKLQEYGLGLATIKTTNNN